VSFTDRPEEDREARHGRSDGGDDKRLAEVLGRNEQERAGDQEEEDEAHEVRRGQMRPLREDVPHLCRLFTLLLVRMSTHCKWTETLSPEES